MLDRLLEALGTVRLWKIEVPNPALPGGQNNFTLRFRDDATQQDQDNAAAIVAAFDWSDAAHNLWLITKLRQQANERFYSKDQIEMGMRALLAVLVDEFNLVRERTVFQFIGVGQGVFDPPNLTANSGVTSPVIDVPGAQVGDLVDVSSGINTAGMTINAFVPAANQVQIRIINTSGSTLNLPSATWGVAVKRYVPLLPRTLEQAQIAVATNIDSGIAD